MNYPLLADLKKATTMLNRHYGGTFPKPVQERWEIFLEYAESNGEKGDKRQAEKCAMYVLEWAQNEEKQLKEN